MHNPKLKLHVFPRLNTWSHKKEQELGPWWTRAPPGDAFPLVTLPYCHALTLVSSLVHASTGREAATFKIPPHLPCPNKKCFFRYLNFKLHFQVLNSCSEVTLVFFLPVWEHYTVWQGVSFLNFLEPNFHDQVHFDFLQNARKQ